MSKKSDICSGLVLCIFGIAYYACSFMIKPTTSDVLGSRFFPRVSAVLLIILALVQIVKALVSKSNQNEDIQSDKADKTKGNLNLPLVLTIVALFAYYILILNIGFTITSILYLLFESYVLMSKEELKNKKLVAIVVIVAIVFPIFLNFVFHNLFSISLPAGVLFE